jgi:hypothetical protein
MVVLLAAATLTMFNVRQARSREAVMRASAAGLGRARKGDVRKTAAGILEYFDGRVWSVTPPPPDDAPF